MLFQKQPYIFFKYDTCIKNNYSKIVRKKQSQYAKSTLYMIGKGVSVLLNYNTNKGTLSNSTWKFNIKP